MIDLVTWLIEETNARGWTNSELARRAGVRSSTISMMISGHNKPGNDLCVGLARALHIPAEEIFRRAGLLPTLPAPADDPVLPELVSYCQRLTPPVRKEILAYVKFRYQQQSINT